MRPRIKAAWAMTALAGLLLTAPGCVIRRGFVVQFDWSLSAHRTGCRHQWFKGRCRTCSAMPCESAALEATPGEVEACEPCHRRSCGGLRGLFHSEELPPPAPEPPGPSNLHPVPTRPVFGNRSEQPDAIEAPMERLAPAPMETNDGAAEAPDEPEGSPADEPLPGEESAMRRPDPRRKVRTVAWQRASRTVNRKQTAAVPECRSCTVRFR